MKYMKKLRKVLPPISVGGWCTAFVRTTLTALLLSMRASLWYAKNYDQLPKAVIIMNSAKRAKALEKYDGRLHAAAELSRDLRFFVSGGFSTRTAPGTPCFKCEVFAS